MEHILSLSYGKDSIACLEAIKQLGLPLDRVIHAEVWATDDVPADLPPMVDFKKNADAVIKKRYGITVEHVCAEKNGQKSTFERIFYSHLKSGKRPGEIYGFPMHCGMWCVSELKLKALSKIDKYAVKYIGIAADEFERIRRHSRKDKVMPLVMLGWNEERCYQWCYEHRLLSPIYTDTARGGCWFCPKQPVNQLRMLRKKYKNLWELLLQWDNDSPVSFKPDGHTVHDYDLRFAQEDAGLIPCDRKFRWGMLDDIWVQEKLSL